MYFFKVHERINYGACTGCRRARSKSNGIKEGQRGDGVYAGIF